MTAWLEFTVLAALVIAGGSGLARYADVLAYRTGLGRTWIGVVLLATVTSAPELLTGISSVTIADATDIAVADVLGSCLFNLTIIAILDVIFRPGVILSRTEQGHILAAGFGLVGMVIVALGLFLAGEGHQLRLAWIGIYTPIIFLLYLSGMRTIYRYEKRKLSQEVRQFREHEAYDKIGKTRLIAGLAVSGLIIIGAATLLPFIAKDIAEASGLGQTFIGMLLVALATSLPEVTSSIAAVRIGALDLAIGGLLGSNLFNINILAMNDLVDSSQPILATVSRSQMLPALASILIGGIVILTLFRQPQKERFPRVTWLSAVILTIYILTALGVFVLENG